MTQHDRGNRCDAPPVPQDPLGPFVTQAPWWVPRKVHTVRSVQQEKELPSQVLAGEEGAGALGSHGS